MKKLVPLILLWSLSLFAWAQPTVKAPAIIPDVVTYTKAVTIKNQDILLVGTLEKPAILALEGDYSNFNDNRVTIVGYGFVVLYDAGRSGVRRNTFQADKLGCLRILRSNDVILEENTFLGAVDPKDAEKQISEDELLYIAPGHPWQFEDAATLGFKYNPATRYSKGENRIAAVNRLNEERRGTYDGSKIVKIVYGDRVPTFQPQYAHLNRWFVWQADNKIQDLEFISATADGVLLRSNGEIKPGAFRYATYNPKALITGNIVRGNWFYGPGKMSGFSAYGTDGLIVEKNVACGFQDYGIGIEVSTRGVLRFNYAYGNQPGQPGQARYWNQFEIVSPLGPHYLKGNNGIVNETIWFYPSTWIQSDRATRKPKVEWLTHLSTEAHQFP